MNGLHVIVCIVLLGIATKVSGQDYGIGLVLGGSQYKGDLSDKTEKWNENLRFAKGVSFNYSLHRTMDFTASFINTYLQAYDRDADDLDRQRRNLHFRSNLNEFSVSFLFYPVSLFSKKEFRFKPFVKTGIGVFGFNPKAEYEGSWVKLKELYTEGQGMPLSGTNSYSLIDISFPFGFGFEYKPFKRLKIRAEVSPRKTYTDYIDDVSTDYYDLNKLRIYSSDMAAKLSYRAEDWTLDNIPDVDGLQRGNPNNNDWYIIHQLSVFYLIGKIPEVPPLDVSPEQSKLFFW